MTTAKTSTEKKPKAKGPLRIEALVPLTLVLVLLGAYFKYFFDSHLRQGLEFGATYAHGAEVNVGDLQTLFLEPSIRIRNIEITDKSDPTLNIIKIGEIKLQLLWDALLRGKFVIPESSILDIQAKNKRRRPGRILPPSKSAGSTGAVNQAAQETLGKLKEKNESNLLGDIFSVAGGTNYKDQLKNLEGQIQTQVKIKALGDELKLKEVEWKKRIDALPDDSEIKQLSKKVEGLKLDTSNPKAIQASLKEIDSVYKEARAKYKNLEEAKKILDQDLKKYQSEYKGLDQLIKQDIEALSAKLNIPSLDPEEINKMLLGSLVANQLGSLLKYQNLVREYMPKKSNEAKEKKQLTPRERAEGVNYTFAKGKSYPRFWLKKAKISSDSKQGEAGDIEGTLQNVTNNPRHLGLPATLDFKGGFPHQNIFDVKGNVTIDHTSEAPVEKGTFSVGSFPVHKNTLSQSQDLELGYNSALGSSTIGFEIKNEQIEINSNSLFSKVDYFASAKDKNVDRLLNAVVQDLNDLTLNIKAQGSWDKLRLNINSNLGDRLVRAIKTQVENEIRKARQQVEEHVQAMVGNDKAKLDQEVQKIEKQLGVSLKSREDAVKSVESAVDKKKKESTQQQKKQIDKLKKEGQKKAKELLKGIKF